MKHFCSNSRHAFSKSRRHGLTDITCKLCQLTFSRKGESRLCIEPTLDREPQSNICFPGSRHPGNTNFKIAQVDQTLPAQIIAFARSNYFQSCGRIESCHASQMVSPHSRSYYWKISTQVLACWQPGFATAITIDLGCKLSTQYFSLSNECLPSNTFSTCIADPSCHKA